MLIPKSVVRFLAAFIVIGLCAVYSLPASAGHNDEPDKAAIIIDDFGGTGQATSEFLNSDLPVTVAVMPFLEHSTSIAEKAHNLGFEVMIHLPMEPKQGKRSWLGPKPILNGLELSEIRHRVEAAVENVPHAKGINQHMGSKIVENRDIMKVILKVADANGLYVVDSGTNPASVIPELCEQMGIPYEVRDLFLDNTHSSASHVYKMALKLADLAQENGEAIGIGHVGIKGMASYNALKQAKPYYNEANVQIVPVSHLIKTKVEKDPDSFWQKQ